MNARKEYPISYPDGYDSGVLIETPRVGLGQLKILGSTERFFAVLFSSGCFLCAILVRAVETFSFRFGFEI